MTWAERILDDGLDTASWERAHTDVIGSYDAASLSKRSSVDKYLAAKLKRGRFQGNEFTRSGNRWEPMMLAWAGITPNHALIHAPAEPGFAATPDGLSGARMAECKAKHGREIDKPALREWRQMAWQFMCVPEAVTNEWIWYELDRDGEPLADEPKSIVIRREDPRVLDQIALMLPIAADLLARLKAVRQYEMEI